jgi:hypothetical protein
MSTLGYISLTHVDQGAHLGGLVAGILSTLLIVYPYSLTETNRPLNGKVKVFLIVLLAVSGLSFIKEIVPLLPLLA